MSADWETRLDFGLLDAALAAAVPIALARGAEVVRGKAVERTPVQTGNLKGGAGVTVHGAGKDAVAEVKYGGPYAAYINRGMTAKGDRIIRNHPGGGVQPGFFTETMSDQAEAVRDEIAHTLGDLL